MKNIFLISILSCCTLSLIGQRYNWRPDAIRQAPNFILKYDLGGLLISEGPFFQLALEHNIKDELYVEYAAGFTRRVPQNNNTITYQIGYNLQTHFKYYLQGIIKENPNYFVGMNLRFNQTFSNRFDTFSLASGAFTRRYNYTRQKSNFGIFGMFGSSKFINRRIVLDSEVGVGYVLTNRQNIGVPDDAVPVRNNDFFWQPAWQTRFDDTPTGNSGNFRVILNLKIGYVLVDRKKEVLLD